MADLYSFLALREYLQRQQLAQIMVPQSFNYHEKTACYGYPGIGLAFKVMPQAKKLSTPEDVLSHPAIDQLCKKIRALDAAIQESSRKINKPQTKLVFLVKLI